MLKSNQSADKNRHKIFKQIKSVLNDGLKAEKMLEGRTLGGNANTPQYKKNRGSKMSGRIKKITAAALFASLLICSCTDIEDDFDSAAEYAAVSADAPKEIHETTAKSSETVTENSVTADADENPSKSAYNMSEEFYTRLDGIIESYPHFKYYDISLAYRDLETGFTLFINPKLHYYSASVMKAPYMLYIYRLALDGMADLEQKLVYTESFKREGTGELKNMEFGTEFTVEELIGYALEESDNAAFAMLRSVYPEEGYTEYIKSLGVVHPDDSKAFNSPQICCETALIFSRAIYDFICEENEYSENLRKHMTSSRNAMIIGGEGSEVVRKYGWYEGYFHDMAVILGDNDYALTIMTNLDMLNVQLREYRIFADLSSLIAEYSGQLYETEESFGNAVIINVERQEVKDMALPKDPYMLLSVLNMKLRDCYGSFEALCEDMEAVSEEITTSMLNLGYAYNEENNQFSPIPEDTENTNETTQE